MKNLSGFVLLFCCLAKFTSASLAQDSKPLETRPAPASPTAAPAYESDPKFQEALAQARERKPLPREERLARWKHANKIAKNECVVCLHQLILLQTDESQWKDVVTSANQLEQVATDPKEKAFAQAERGLSLLHFNNDKPKTDQLQTAESSLRASLEISPRSLPLLFAEGRTLAMLGRDDEGKQIFERYLKATNFSDPYRARVEHFIDNPRLATMPMAPAFTLTTSEGEQISLDEMGGKVVLLDFWATWCGPCRQTLPEIQRIAAKFKDQPLLVLSISGDANDIAWKEFIQKNNMTWPQYLDKNGSLRRAYGVSSIPRFFTIDADGVLQSIQVGTEADPEGEVRKLLKRAGEAEKRKALDGDKARASE